MIAMPRRAAVLCLAAALAGLAVAGCTKDDKEPAPASSSPTPSVSAAPGTGQQTSEPTPSTSASASPSASATGVDFGDPEAVASAFVYSYVLQDWAVDGPRGYLDRIRPYSTAAYVKKLRDTSSDRCDLICQGDKKSGVKVTADDIGTVIPDEAPRSANSAWVQVSYTERTSWEGGGDGSDTGMVLVLTKSGGKWLVNGRMGSE
ncbi:hypothetical protein OG562_23180 [Streptomyces sp. NBC_01275]|uniref:hypothetical protein n=1 Tax=Streptomyces sp. NBC_01275 TaxID=2903807 RepID=UPI00224E9C97|nr:hypothetical protein [Streptomyces sp. NBC_01275]MCX4763817.1 hypothetical protein [Streptomyces sp. NBC_01275]